MLKERTSFALPDSGTQIRREEIDSILYTAFNAGGIAGWADRIFASEKKQKRGKKVYEHIGTGGSILIHDMIDNRVYLLDSKRLLKGIELYIGGGCESIDNGELVKAVDVNDANCIVQLAIFGEVKHQ